MASDDATPHHPQDDRTVQQAHGLGDGRTLLTHRIVLFCAYGDGPQSSWDFESPRVAIGSADGNDVVLSDPAVSRRHCEIVVRDGTYRLRDLESTNGTFVGETRVQEAYLQPGTRFRVGDTWIEFEPDTRLSQLVPTEESSLGEMVGVSESMRSVFALFREVGPSQLTTLLVGETGTGKELAARALHGESGRGPFVVVDCAALHENLMQAELFGVERGAFTGADKRRPGAFENAQSGTLFLDEVGELPLDMQPRLLRVLERREVSRLGGHEVIDLNVRVVAATHRDLLALVREGRFREDLYYRLAEIVVELPPLRQRLEDLQVLSSAILAGEAVLAQDGLAWLRTQRFP
ncbi:MAG: sigma-54-dependent Fis family transcriptional regulator, partial [Myxococcota bacterium]